MATSNQKGSKNEGHLKNVAIKIVLKRKILKSNAIAFPKPTNYLNKHIFGMYYV